MPKLVGLKEILIEEEEKERLIPELLAAWVEIELTETDTIYFLEIHGVLVSQYSEDANNVIKRNEGYTSMCKAIENNSDLMTNSSIETCHPLEVTNEIQSDPIIMTEIGCRASSWDLYDSIMDPSPIVKESGNEKDMNARLLMSLNLIECLLSMNLNQVSLSAFRKNKAVENSNERQENQPPNFTYMWSLTSPLIQEKPVTCFTLNPYNYDMLCVGYGSMENNNQDDGIICCWELKNLLHPHRCLKNPSSVASIDFSLKQSNVLACGLFDGTIIIWDILPPKGKILWNSRDHHLYHFGPIWAIKWTYMPITQRLMKGSMPMHEVLMSASEDGKVCQWDIDKSIKNDVLELKVRNFQLYQNEPIVTSSLIACQPIWSLHLNDSTADTYMVSTGMGSVHLCSILHQVKVLQTYKGHQGPIYNLRISPLDKNIFCTCSADSTIKVWHKDCDSCIMTLQTTMNPVYDIDWFPFSSTVFASVCPDRFDIWDLNVSRLEPLVTKKVARKQIFTAILFAKNSTSIFVGSDNGTISTYLITGLIGEGNQTISALIDELRKNKQKDK